MLGQQDRGRPVKCSAMGMLRRLWEFRRNTERWAASNPIAFWVVATIIVAKWDAISTTAAGYMPSAPPAVPVAVIRVGVWALTAGLLVLIGYIPGRREAARDGLPTRHAWRYAAIGGAAKLIYVGVMLASRSELDRSLGWPWLATVPVAAIAGLFYENAFLVVVQCLWPSPFRRSWMMLL